MSLRAPDGLDAVAWNADGLVPVVVQEVASGAVLMLAWADREALSRTLERGEGWFWSRSRRRLWRKGETSGHALAVAEVAVDCDGDAVLYRVDATGPTCHTGARSCFESAGGEAVVATSARAPEPAEPIAEEANESAAADSAAGGDRGGGVAARFAAGERSSTREAGDAARAAKPEEAAVAGTASGTDRPALAGPRLELGWLWDALVARASADPATSYTARLLAGGIDRIARKVGEEATEVVIAALRAAPPPHPTAGAHLRPPALRSTAGASPAPSITESAPPPASPLGAEVADLLYHLLVLLLTAGVPPEEVAAELRRRHARAATPASPKPEDRP